MLRSFILFLLLTVSTSIWAQDRIVTVTFDTIICKIIEVKDYSIVYLPNTNRRPEHIAIAKTLSVEKNVTDDIKRLQERKINVKEFFRDNAVGWAFGFTGGYGHLAGRVDMPSGFENYVRQLRNGFNFGMDITYFPGKFFGAGIRYNLFNTQARLSNVSGTNRLTGQPFFGTISDNVDIHSVVARFTGRFMTKDRSFFFMPSVSSGYVRRDNSTRAGTEFNIVVQAMSFGSNFSFDFRVYRTLFVGLDLGFITASSRNVRLADNEQVKLERLEKENRFSIMRFDAGLSVRYYL